MCDKRNTQCEHPERLKDGGPQKCSPEQIKKCHGDVKRHLCTQAKK